MALLSTKIHKFTILIGSNIFPLLVPTLPMSSYGTCPISLSSVGLSLRFFSRAISTSRATYLVTMACVCLYIWLFVSHKGTPPPREKFLTLDLA